MLDVKAFGARLAELRRRTNMRQRDVARAVGVTAQAVSNWETGKSFPDLCILDELALALGVEIRDLFEPNSNIE